MDGAGDDPPLTMPSPGARGAGDHVCLCRLVLCLLCLLLCATPSRSEPPPLRPLWTAGDPLWTWPEATHAALRSAEASLTWVSLSGWQPFAVDGLHAATWETGCLRGGWGGGLSGVLIAAPLSRMGWIDAVLIRRGDPLKWWLSGGTGFLTAGEDTRRTGSSGAAGFRLEAGPLGFEAAAQADRARRGYEGGTRLWGWGWRTGATARTGAVALEALYTESFEGGGTALVGMVWDVMPAGRSPGISAAFGADPALGTVSLRFTIRPSPSGPALGAWTHLHPVLGRTPGATLSWGAP